MKPAKFDYLRAASVQQAVAALDQEEGAATFADYLMPSVHEIPGVKDVEYCTPSPLNLTIHELPMRMHKLEALINEAKT